MNELLEHPDITIVMATSKKYMLAGRVLDKLTEGT
jgi:hypothetical protein